MGPHLAGDFFHSFAYVKKTVKKSCKPFLPKRDVERVDPGKSKETATGFGNSPSRNKGGDGFSPTTSEQKWHKTKDSQLRIIRWQKCFFGKKNKRNAFFATDFPAIPSEIG